MTSYDFLTELSEGEAETQDAANHSCEAEALQKAMSELRSVKDAIGRANSVMSRAFGKINRLERENWQLMERLEEIEGGKLLFTPFKDKHGCMIPLGSFVWNGRAVNVVTALRYEDGMEPMVDYEEGCDRVFDVELCVLDANGEPITVGDTVYVVNGSGVPRRVEGINPEASAALLDDNLGSVDGNLLAHRSPDSWEELEKSAHQSPTYYAMKCKGLSHGEVCLYTYFDMMKDLVSRAKRLAGVEND
nr:MAG TPA: hypothetical protein [Caudoviricetes sp.]